MAQNLFSAGIGVELLSQDFTSRTHILTGTSTPGGDGDVQDAAPIGSLFLRQDVETDGLQLYYKSSTANNSAADWSQATNKEYVDSVAQGLSWREPARVLDPTIYANVAAIPTTGTIDGVTLVDGDRALFTNITTGNSNVYIWDAGGTSWSEDPNAATDGDAVLITEGSFAEQQWVYDGTLWVQFGGAANGQELEFIRNFIGKTAAGAEMPSYSSTNVVTAGVNLEVAIGELDAGIGDCSYTNDYVIVDGEAVALSLDKIDTAIGDRTYTENNVIADGEAVAASLEKLDVAVGALQVQNLVVNTTNVTASTVVDSIALADADNVQWMVIAENTGDSTNRQSSIINALHDGTNVDFSRFGTNKTGPNIAGINVAVQVNGGNLELLVSSTTAVDVGVKRVGLVAAN